MTIFNFDKIDGFSEQVSRWLPRDPQMLAEDFRNSLRPVLEATLARMNLVTREDFEQQTAVLRRTREKLEALEKRLAELENEA